MYNYDESDLTRSYNSLPFFNEYSLANEESFVLPDKGVDRIKKKMNLIQINDSTKETFPKGNNEKKIRSGKVQKKENKNMGEKKNSQLTGEHNKYMPDNIRRKIKHLITKISLKFKNEKIREKYQSFVGDGVFIKQLLIINSKQLDDSTVDFNRKLLTRSIGDIFSDKISTR